MHQGKDQDLTKQLFMPKYYCNIDRNPEKNINYAEEVFIIMSMNHHNSP